MIKQGVVIGNLNSKDIMVEKGLAKAILPEEMQNDYYRWVKHGERGFDTALEERIRLPYENGMLVVRKQDGSIKFDDRKLRFSGYFKVGNQYVLQIAPTHFGEIKRTDVRAAMDENFERYLLERGMEEFNDEMAYFACSVAVNAVPITREGHVHIFRRSDSQELFPGRWDVTGGFVDIEDRIFDFHMGDMSKTFRDLLYHNTRKEFVEETGNTQDTFELTGLVKGANFVFTHRALLDITSQDFIGRLGYAADSSGADKHLVLKSKEELSRFLETEYGNTSPTAYHALRFHLERL